MRNDSNYNELPNSIPEYLAPKHDTNVGCESTHCECPAIENDNENCSNELASQISAFEKCAQEIVRAIRQTTNDLVAYTGPDTFRVCFEHDTVSLETIKTCKHSISSLSVKTWKVCSQYINKHILNSAMLREFKVGLNVPFTISEYDFVVSTGLLTLPTTRFNFKYEIPDYAYEYAEDACNQIWEKICSHIEVYGATNFVVTIHEKSSGIRQILLSVEDIRKNWVTELDDLNGITEAVFKRVFEFKFNTQLGSWFRVSCDDLLNLADFNPYTFT